MNLKTHIEKQNNWEQEFNDADFSRYKPITDRALEVHCSEIKCFIRKLLRSNTLETLRWVNGLLPTKQEKIDACAEYAKDLDESIAFDDGWDEGLTRFSTLLENEIKSLEN